MTVGDPSGAALLTGIAGLPDLASSIAGRDAHLTADQVRETAPIVVLLMRRFLANRLGESNDAAMTILLDIVGRLTRVATRRGAHEIAQGLDWWMVAYTGVSYNGAFWTGTAMHPELHRVLREGLNLAPSGSLIRRPLEHIYDGRKNALRALGDRPIATNRDTFEQLLLKPIDAVIERLERDPLESIDDIILGDPDRMVARADQAGTIPRNGSRWPQLVRMAETLQTRAYEFQTIARALASPSFPIIRNTVAPPNSVSGSLFDAVLLLDLEGAIVDDDQLARAVDSAALIANAENRFPLATLLNRCEWTSDWVSGVQTELEQVLRRFLLEIEESTVGLGDAQIEEYASEAVAAAEWGLTREAEEWVGLLRESSQRLRVDNVIRALEARLGTLRSPGLQVAVGEIDRINGILEAATQLLESGELATSAQLAAQADGVLSPLLLRLGIETLAGPTSTQRGWSPSVSPEEAPAIVAEESNRGDVSAPDTPTAARRTPTAQHQSLRTALTTSNSAELLRILSEVTDDDLPGMVETIRQVTPIQHRFVVWNLTVQALQQRRSADKLLVGFRQPRGIDCGGREARPADSGVLRVRMPHMKVPHSATERFPGIGPAMEAKDPVAAAEMMRRVWEDGWAPALNLSIAYYLRASLPAEAIELYRESRNLHRPEFVSAGVAWSVAVAYELLDEHAAAAEALEYAINVSPASFDTAQREQLSKYFESIGKDRPVWPNVEATEDGENSSPTPSLLSHEQQETVRARQEFEQGDAKAAENRLRRLIDTVPRSPGSFLLLKIFREQGRYLDAQRFMEQLDSRQAASWWHYVQLARVALESEQGTAALAALQRAQSLDPIACENSSDFIRLQGQANDIATLEARSVATLGGEQLSADAVERLARDGNLNREDWTRATRRLLSEGSLSTVLATAATVSKSATWAVPVVVRALIDLSVPVDADMRTPLLRLLRQNTDITATLQLIERINEREMDQTRTLDADGEVESLLRRLLATAPQRTQPGIAWELATMLRSQDRPHDAQIVLDGTFPPIRLPTAEIAAPPLPAPEPIDPRYTITGSMSETFAAAISAQNQARPIEEQRDLWLAALATGERPGLALPAALAALVRSGQNVAAIEAYMNVAEAAYPSGSAAWNLACALAGVGDYELAVSWFTYSFEVGATDLSDGRRQLRDAIFARVGVAPPRTAPDLQVPTSGTLTEAQFLEATKQLAEEFKTKAIDVETARVRLAQLTDRARPSEPTRLQSARLMLEFGQSAEAFDRLATMMRAGVSDLQSGSRLLTLAACATDREPEAAEILERHADVHYVCLDIARLCNQLRQLEHAIQWAQRAVDIKPSYLESAHYLEILQQTGAGPEIRGQSNADASVVFAGLRADGSVELIVSVVTDDAIQDAEIVTDQKTFWIGDIGADTSCVIPVTSDSNSAIKKLTFAWVSEGRAAEQDVEIPDPVTPGPITLPFDPTQPANSRLFVGRESEIEWLTSHYRSHTQVLFISGPRQVGKTSIVRQLRLKSRLDTGLPLVVIMEGDVYQKEHSFLTQVSDAIMVELNKSSLECPPAPSIDRVADFNLWMIKSVRPLIGDRVLLIALDEVQRVLDACTEEGSGDSRESIAGNIRTLSSDTDLRVRFLLLGSCTYSSVRDRLEHTTLAAEILERQIGFLDRRDTRELVTRGFEQADGGATYVAESAHEAFWELTAGYPNHVHLLGQRVGVLLNNSHQRSVDWEIVEAAAERLVQDGTRAVDHFVGREAKSSSQEHVLVKLAEYFGNNEGIDAAPSLFELTREIGTEHQDGIVRLVRLGLLREEPDGTVHVANGLVKSWLVRNAYLLSTSRQLRASSVEYTPFKERGFEVNPGRPDGIGQRLVLKTQGAVYLARSLHLSGEPPRPITTAGQSLDSVGLFDQRLERWVVLTHAEGEALDYYLEGLDSENWELSDTRKVVQAVSDTMATLSRCRDDCRCNHGKWVHGNLTPARIITRAQRGVFIAELALGADDQQTELTQLERDIYRPPEQLQRWKDKKGFKESDDVFALGVILTVTLREDHQPPYPETSDGVSDTSATEDSEIWVPRKWRTGVDKNLLRVITSMCKADLTERSSLDVARSSLTKWIDQL